MHGGRESRIFPVMAERFEPKERAREKQRSRDEDRLRDPQGKTLVTSLECHVPLGRWAVGPLGPLGS